MKDFRDKVVVITGAGSGIGKATAEAFAKEGARLHLTDVIEERVKGAAEEINRAGGKATAYVVDSADPAAMEKFAEQVYAAEGRVDILHNNAGVGVSCRVEKLTLEAWQRIININLWGVIHGVHFFLPRMIAQGGGGHIVITASAAGLTSAPTLGAYNTTKFALVGLAETMSIELPRHGIYTTVLCPGIINTPLIPSTPMDVCDKEGDSYKGRAEKFYRDWGVGPERVARDVLKAVRKRRPVQTSPWSHVNPLWLVKRISPRAFIWLFRTMGDKLGYV